MTDDPKITEIVDHPYALVADVNRDPGSCAVYHLLHTIPGGLLARRLDPEIADAPVGIPGETIITRGADLDQVKALKAMLDKAWADSGEAMLGYKVDVGKIVAEHGRKLDVTSSEALKAFGIRAVIDVEGATNALLDNAQKRRTAAWTFVVNQLATLAILPEKALALDR